MSADQPEWLNAGFIKKALKSSGKEDVEIVEESINIKPGVGKGESYASSLLRVQTELSNGETFSIMVKSAPSGVESLQHVIHREAVIYREVLPAMHKALEKVNRLDEPIAPRALHWQVEPDPALVLEDLSAAGFRLENRHTGMDMDHLLLIMKHIARFHAASVHVHRKDPDMFSGYKPTMGKHNDYFMQPFALGALKHFIADVETWDDELSRRAAPKLRALSETYLERQYSVYQPENARFLVVNHGDLWTNNVLFKHDNNGKVESLRLIDFQTCYVGSPALDLHHVITVSSNQKVRSEKGGREKLLRAYHQELSATMRDLALPEEVIPSFQDLQDEMERTSITEVQSVIANLPIIQMPTELSMDFQTAIMDVHEGDGLHPRRIGLQQPSYRQVAQMYLAKWDEVGLLDLH